jgi:RHS repeat-associated protein
VGDKRYELSNHLGNVLSVVSDRKLFQNTLSFTTFAPDVLSYSDYYPFGMLVPNRHKAGDDYRYGFQGQEKDDEIKGEGNSINYTFRMHDPRVGRFFAPDPLEKKYPNYTPYSFSGNKVINSVEIEGLEDSFYMLGKKIYNGEAYFELVNVLEVGGEVELITGTKMKTAFADRVHVYGSDGHWHTISDKLRNTSLNNLGGSREIFAQINKGEIVDAGYEMASKLKSLERIGNTASAAIAFAYVGQALKDIKGIKSIINTVGKNNIRENYTSAVNKLKSLGELMLKSGVNERNVAKTMNNARRAIGEMFKDITPADLRGFIYKFNEKRYGDKLGPTYEFLKKQGKTDAQIIEGSSRPLGDMKDLGKALYKEFGEEIKPILQKYKMIDK